MCEKGKYDRLDLHFKKLFFRLGSAAGSSHGVSFITCVTFWKQSGPKGTGGKRVYKSRQVSTLLFFFFFTGFLLLHVEEIDVEITFLAVVMCIIISNILFI